MRTGKMNQYTILSKGYDLLDILFFRVKGKNPRNVIEETILKEHPQKVVDLCCGTMNNSLQIAKLHPECEILGIDLSKDMLRVAEKKVKKEDINNVVLKRADATKTGLKSNFADIVIIGLALHECSPELRNEILHEVHRILKADGKLIILEWEASKQLIRNILFAPMYLLETLYTKTFPAFYRSDKQTCFESNGFKTVKLTHCNYSVVIELKKIERLQHLSQPAVEFDNSTYGSWTTVDKNCKVRYERRHIVMNQIDTGKFIANCRKEKGLTQSRW